jgi:hypothetical protein
MALKMRLTGLGHGVYKDVPDYSVFCGKWCIGRIYRNRSGPEDIRWFWALHAPGGRDTLRSSNQVATLEIAKAEFENELEAMEGVGGAGRGAVGSGSVPTNSRSPTFICMDLISPPHRELGRLADGCDHHSYVPT